MGSLDDGYTSSTGYFSKAYKKRPQDFKRRVIYYHQCDDVKSLRDIEHFILRWHVKHEELDKRYYNLKRAGNGFDGTQTRIQQLNLAKDGKMWQQSKEGREKISIWNKNRYIEGNSPLHTQKIKQKSAKNTSKRLKDLAKIGKHWAQQPENKKRISNALKLLAVQGKLSIQQEEVKQKRIKNSIERKKELKELGLLWQQQPENKAHLGSFHKNTMWINDGIKETKIMKTEKIPDNFKKGRISRKRKPKDSL